MSTFKRNLLIFIGVLMVGLLASAAARPAGEYTLLLRLNGEPTKLGTIYILDAGSVTNATTSIPFTLSSSVIEVTCTAAACCRPGLLGDAGTAVSCTYTSDEFGRPLVAGVPRSFVLQPTTTSFSCVPNNVAATSCDVAQMN